MTGDCVGGGGGCDGGWAGTGGEAWEVEGGEITPSN